MAVVLRKIRPSSVLPSRQQSSIFVTDADNCIHSNYVNFSSEVKSTKGGERRLTSFWACHRNANGLMAKEEKSPCFHVGRKVCFSRRPLSSSSLYDQSSSPCVKRQLLHNHLRLLPSTQYVTFNNRETTFSLFSTPEGSPFPEEFSFSSRKRFLHFSSFNLCKSNDGDDEDNTQRKFYSSKLPKTSYGHDDSYYGDLYKSSYDEFRQSGALPEMKDPLTDAAKLTHLDEKGKARMVDISDKAATKRTAKAKATIFIGETAFNLVKDQSLKKGDVLTVSQLAGIMAAKKTSDLIPLCHPLKLTSVHVKIGLNEEDFCLEVVCEAKCRGPTGIEMEALTGATVAALTVYDMCKSATKDMEIREIKLLRKTGGKSGDYKYVDPDSRK